VRFSIPYKLEKREMKRMFVTAAVAVTMLGASAGVLDLQSRATLQKMRMEQIGGKAAKCLRAVRGARVAAPAQTSTLAFVSLAEGASASDLEADGMIVKKVIGNIAIVEVGLADVETMAASKAVRTMQLPRDLKMHMDIAKAESGVDVMHAGGDGLPQAYTGKGVLAGIVDQGIDPHHINFLDAEGKNRIEYLSHIYINSAGTALVEKFYGDPDDIIDAQPLETFVTDEASVYHATHTLGIMAGGYAGKVEVCDGLDGNQPNIVEKANPFGGIATGANIGVASGVLNDIGIAYGMDYLVGYGAYKQLPMVLNLSVGSNVGPHDKNSMMSQVLRELGKEAIICVSAGNEGDLKIHLHKTFESDDETVSSFLYPYVYQYDPNGDQEDYLNNTIRSGSIVFYSDDSTPFEVQAIIYNKSRGYRAVQRFVLTEGGASGLYYGTDANWASAVSGIEVDANSVFAKNFYGYIGGGAMIDEDTNRYYAMIDMHLFDWNDNKESGQYVVGFQIKGKAGQRVDCYAEGLTYWIDNLGVDGFADGSRNGSISDMAVADNIIAVGAYNTRRQWQCLDGTVSSYPGDGFAPGKVSEFSSFGTLADGTNLPVVCAPGSTIISSVSGPYLDYTIDQLAANTGYTPTEAEREEYKNYLCQARATVDGKQYYWKQEPGTSMSTPFVAGSIALWLEADPTLGVDEAIDIIRKTATVDDAVRAGDPVQWGAGKFNALAGLKEVIRRASGGIDGVQADSSNDRLMVTPAGGNRFNIFVGDATTLDVALYNLNGGLVLGMKAYGDEATLDASAIAGGIYLLTVNGHSRKLIIK